MRIFGQILESQMCDSHVRIQELLSIFYQQDLLGFRPVSYCDQYFALQSKYRF